MHSRIDLFGGDITIYLTPIRDDDSVPRRQREKQAVADLVVAAIGHESHIEHTADGAPFVPGLGRPVSVSHSRCLAALAVGRHPNRRIGIDVEEMRPQLTRVAPRVLSEREVAQYSQQPDGLLKAWTMKEALYKAAGMPGLDFSTEIELPDIDAADCVASVRGVRFDCRFHYCGNTMLCAVRVSNSCI